MTEFIDPEELPFTEEEVRRAGGLFLPSDAASEMARHLSDCGPQVIEAREERRASWRASGMSDAHWMPLHALCYPKDLLPALASLSRDAEARARFLKEDSWRNLYRGVVSRMQRETLERSGAIPSAEEMFRQATEAAVTRQEKRRLKNGFVFQGPPPPLPTTAMVTAAHAEVAAERAKWVADVERFRRRHDGAVDDTSGA